MIKEEADRLMKIQGKTKGSEFLTLAKYIETKYGKEGVEKLEKKMAELGYPLNFDEIKPAHWYLESLNVLAMISAKELFGWPNFFKYGYDSPAFSFGVKVFIKFFPFSIFTKEVSKIWRKFVDIGSLEVYELNEKERYLLLHHKNYNFHPEMCAYYAGFFLRITEFLIKSKKITIKETKCIHKGDPYHEYLIKWQ